MSTQGFPGGNGEPPLRRGAAPSVTLTPAGLAEATALSFALPPSAPGVGKRTPAEVVASLARDRILLSATDPRGSLVGLATLRRHPHGLLLGWAVLPDRLGEGLGLRIAEEATARAFATGVPEVVCQAGGRNHHARQVLDVLGYRLKLLVPGTPTLYAVDPVAFAARKTESAMDARRHGVATPESCAPVHPAEWRVRVPTPSERLWTPITAGDLLVRRAGPGDEAAVASLLPYGVVPDGDPTVVDAFLTRTMEEQAVMLGIDADGTVVGSVNVSVGARGGYEIGWFVVDGHRRRGHAGAIAEAVLDCLFQAGVPEVTCAVDAGNAPSLRTAARLGFDAGWIEADGTVALSLAADAFDNRPAPGLSVAA